ncbi:MAG TPA: MAPEG family protein [Bauldia sp.]|nr:MAPEG family protein [Bauldia sp.]
MSTHTVLAPVFVEVALTFALLLWLGILRVRLVRAGAVRTHDVALGEPNWPENVVQVGNAFRNQLEVPVLFYLLLVIAAFTGRGTLVLVVLAWLFVVSRLLHALIHVTTNNMARRFALFGTGVLILIAMWLIFAIQFFVGA